jgi:hypothetical protein
VTQRNWWEADAVVDAGAGDQVLAPPQQATPQGRMDRFLTGAGDLLQGGAQLMVNALPTGAVGAVNDATAWVNRQPIIGPATRAIGMTPATADQVNARVAQREATFQDGRQMAGAQPNDTDWWRMGGNVAGSLPLALMAPVGGTLLRAGASGAAQGAALGAAQPVTDPNVDYWSQVGGNAGLGAATGGLGGAAAHGVSRAITGAQNVAPAVRELNDRGVQMTPGQIVGGYTRRVEDAAGSVPVLGAQIRGGQRASIESFNRATANEVLAPLGASVAPDAEVGRNLLTSVDDQISAAYTRALPRIPAFGPDQQFYQDLQGVSQNFLTPNARDQFQRFMQDNILPRTAGGQIDGETWKRIDEVMGRFVREYRGSLDPAQREMGTAAQGVQRAFRELLGRVAPPEAAEVRAANEAFARLIRMENAAGRQGAVEGVFSPAQLDAAVRITDGSPRRGAYARGDALMQDLSDAGRAVLPSTVPDSGTPERLALMALLGGGAGMGASTAGFGLVPSIAAGTVGAGAYSNAGQRMLQSLLLGQRPAAVTAAGNALAPAGAPLGVALGAMLLDPPPAPNRLDQRR